MKRTVIELFAGVGGFRVGLNNIKGFDENGKAIENGSWDFVWANQWEPSTRVQHAFDCYTTRFGKSGKHSNDDISKVDKKQIPDHSLLVGGFPCQDYSVARSLSGEQGIEGKKGVLFWQIAEILEKKKTPFVLLENVDRLLRSPSTQRGRDFGIMLRTFHELGYNLEWRVINAADYGLEQRRRRVFIFAWRRDLRYNNKYLIENANDLIFKNGFFSSLFPVEKLTLNENVLNDELLMYSDMVKMSENFSYDFEKSGILINGSIFTHKVIPVKKENINVLDNIREKGNHDKYYLTDNQIKKIAYLRGSKCIKRIKPNGEVYYYKEGSMSEYDSWDLPGRTMLTSEATLNRSTHIVKDYDSKKLRFLTPIEAERLQNFPDNWTQTGMPERRRYFMMGNALVTGLIAMMSEKLKQIVDEE